MPITRESARQYPMYAEVAIAFGDVVSGAAEKAILLPAGAVVVDVQFAVTTAWDSATTAVITTIGDDLDPDRYYAAGTFNLKTANNFLQGTGASPEALITGHRYTTPNSVDIVITVVGATAAGVGVLRVGYLISGQGRAHEVQPTNSSI